MLLTTKKHLLAITLLVPIVASSEQQESQTTTTRPLHKNLDRDVDRDTISHINEQIQSKYLLLSSGELHQIKPTDELVLSGHTARVKSVAWNPDGTHILTTSDDGTVRIWNGSTGICEQTLGDPAGPIGSMLSAAWIFSGNYLLTATKSFVEIWNNSTGRWRCENTLQHSQRVELSGVLYSTAGNFGENYHLDLFWSPEEAIAQVRMYIVAIRAPHPRVEIFRVDSHVQNSDNNRMVVLSNDNAVRMYQRKLLCHLKDEHMVALHQAAQRGQAMALLDALLIEIKKS